jgi:L-iditol 2-dehydrogenase
VFAELRTGEIRGMKAAVMHGDNDLRLEEVATPEANPGEVVVQVKASGICATDVKILAGTSRPRTVPMILGHEVAEFVHEMGAGVQGLEVGQRVAVYPIASCGRCFFCKRDRHSLCENEFGLAHGIDGGFAEYVRIPERLVELGGVVPIQDDLAFDLAAMSEPLSCCISAFNSAGASEGDWVTIVGAGPMGLLHLVVARSRGLRVIVVDVVQERLEMAREMGADIVIDGERNDPIEAVRDATRIGSDLVVAALGVTEVVEKCFPMVRNGGTFNIFGGPPRGASLTIDPRWLHYGEITLTGTFASSLPDFKQALGLIAAGQVDVSPIISHRVGLDGLLDAVQKVQQHQSLKGIVIF